MDLRLLFIAVLLFIDGIQSSEVPAAWSTWSPWSPCSVTCGRGRVSRGRSCDGEGCEGLASDVMTCFKEACPGSGYQLEAQGDRELLGNTSFDDTWLAGNVMVPPGVDAEKLKTDMKNEFLQIGDDFDSLSVFSTTPWSRGVLGSCPRSQHYGCASEYRQLPCSRQFVHGAMRTCCPIYPSYIVNRAAHCNCCKCGLLSGSSAQCGKCHRRYTYNRVMSYCLGPEGSDVTEQWRLHRHMMHIPSSCHCKAGC